MKIYDCELCVESCMTRNVNDRLGRDSRERESEEKSKEKVKREEAVIVNEIEGSIEEA